MKRSFSCFILLCVVAVGTIRSGAAQPSQGAQEQTPNIRVAAEWEPAVGVLISWPLTIPHSLVVAFSKDVDLYVTVAKSKKKQAKAEAALKGMGIPANRLHFLPVDQGLDGFPYTRDWGPYALFDDKGDVTLVDGRYLGYPVEGLESNSEWLKDFVKDEPKYQPDDDAPAAVAHATRLPRLELPIALTGGTIVFDGHGTAFATQMLVDENSVLWGVSEEKLRQIMRERLGVTRLYVLPNFSKSSSFSKTWALQHIDCLLALLDENRILVMRVPKDHPDYDTIEAVVQRLSQLKTPSGQPYQILRIDTARYHGDALANYANALILNRKVYVPLFGIPADQQALDTWKAAMPGYEVLGFPSLKGIDAWADQDALHCRTRAIWAWRQDGK